MEVFVNVSVAVGVLVGVRVKVVDGVCIAVFVVVDVGVEVGVFVEVNFGVEVGVDEGVLVGTGVGTIHLGPVIIPDEQPAPVQLPALITTVLLGSSLTKPSKVKDMVLH